jgi:hypothetical protein
MWATETVLIRRLEAEWRIFARSRWLRSRLQTWSVEDDRLAFDDGDQLVAAAQRRNAASWTERDQVLAALLERATEDPVARRVAFQVALQVVLPGVKSLIDGIRGWDVEERAARVVATTVDVLAWCAAEPAGTPPSFRVYVNTRRRVLRSAIRDRAEPVVFVDDYTHLETRDDPPDDSYDGDGFDRLVQWVQRHGHVREDAARLVVLTRTAGVSVAELASARNVDPQTLRQRRLRAERRIRHGVSLVSGISDTDTRRPASHTPPTGRTAQ